MTTARTRQLTYRLRRHRPAPCRNICPMGRAGWKQPSIIMPRPVSRPPGQHHTTTMNNHARIQWGMGWRTIEQTAARKKDVHGCSNERKYAAESKITVSGRPESYAMNDVHVHKRNHSVGGRAAAPHIVSVVASRWRWPFANHDTEKGTSTEDTSSVRLGHTIHASCCCACMHARDLPRRSRAA